MTKIKILNKLNQLRREKIRLLCCISITFQLIVIAIVFINDPAIELGIVIGPTLIFGFLYVMLTRAQDALTRMDRNFDKFFPAPQKQNYSSN